MLTPSQRSMRASIAALTRWSKEDPTVNAERGQAGLKAKFVAQVEADAAERGETLTEAERDRRAAAAYRAHMKRLRFAASRTGGEAA